MHSAQLFKAGSEPDSELDGYLPGEPVLIFKDLSYSVKVSKWKQCKRVTYEKKLLEGITGAVKRGELVALMGASGAGKTVLLDLLSLRKTDTSLLTGVLLHNNARRKRLANSESAYVMQSDVALPNLTVTETLQYASRLRLPESTPEAVKSEIVHDLLEELGLTHCAQSRVGNNQIRGISGGELRRLSIAQELINDPMFLFLDEPTSGLDSTTAYNLVRLLQKLARTRNQAVLCSIHQPSPQAFALFDRVLLLAKANDNIGRIAYFGPTCDLDSYLKDQGCPPHGNYSVIDYAIELTNPAKEEGSSYIGMPFNDSIDGISPQNIFVNLAEKWQSSTEGTTMYREVEKVMPSEEEIDTPSTPHFATSFLNQLRVYTHRSFVDMVRSPGFVFTRILKLHIVGLIVCTVYAQLSYSPEDVQNRISLLFFMLLCTFLLAQTFLPVLLLVRPLTNRERNSSLYGASTQFFGTLLSQLPLDLINALIFAAYAYWVTNLNPSTSAFASFLLMFFAVEVMMIGFILCVSAVAETGEQAAALASLGFLPMVILCGFFVIDLPLWWDAVSYASPLRYALFGVMFSEFHDVEFDCSIDCVSPEECVTDCNYPDGNALLDFYGVDIDSYSGFYAYVAIVSCFALGFYVALYLALRFFKFEHR